MFTIHTLFDRKGLSEDIAIAAVFLTSDDAAPITGQQIWIRRYVWLLNHQE